MNLNLNPDLASGYKSKSQIARVVTEAWFDDYAYCPACKSNELERLPDNMKVIDFLCPKCDEKFQLKSKSKKFGNTISNSEYYTKIEKIKKGQAPNYVFLQYDNKDWLVQNMMIVPKHFMTIESIQARNPLSSTARRAGWVGSNILLNRLPPDARLIIVQDNEEISKNIVRKNWKQFEFLKNQKLENKGWLNDILTCVRELDKKTFTLDEMYSFDSRLQELHPDNKHTKPKIRQQLQVLRDNGVLEFVDRGKYRLR